MFDLIILGLFIYFIVYLFTFLFLDCDFQTAFFELFGKRLTTLNGKVVFITGASSGIGEYTAIALAKQGAKLVLVARRREELERVKNKCLEMSLNKLGPNDVLVLPMDLTDLSSHSKNFEYAVRHFGRVDILFNNAGRSQRAIFENIEIDVDRQIFELNTFACVNLSRVAVNYFNTIGGGQIAVISSSAGVFGVPYSASYTASKHALHGYFNALRAEKVGRSIAVSLICPGPTFSNFLQESFTDKVNKKYGETVKPTDNRMTTERCAHLCCVTLANKLGESWLGVRPVIACMYFAVYFPVLYNFVLKTVGPERLFRMRDSKKIDLQEDLLVKGGGY